MSLWVPVVPLPRFDHHGQTRACLEREDCRLPHPWFRTAQRAPADDPGPGMALAETSAVTESDHIADRPSWDCRSCGKPWPCNPARKALASEMDRTSLAIYMWVNLEEAVCDLPKGPPSELFERFLSWTR